MLSSGKSKSFDSAVVGWIPNVHNDDIHGICVSGDHIVTGSKDSTVKALNWRNFMENGTYVGKVISTNRGNYFGWVTALDRLPDESIVIGHRDGMLRRQGKSGVNYSTVEQVSDMVQYKPGDKQSKLRNHNRVHSIRCLQFAEYENYDWTMLVGTDRRFFHYDFKRDTVLGDYAFRSKTEEWVYGFEPINATRVAVIHACSVSVLRFTLDAENNCSNWALAGTIIKGSKQASAQKAFVSSMCAIGTQHLAVSMFDGSTKVLDIATNKVVYNNRAHVGRVWQVLSLDNNQYLSCADDATIRLWDMRVGTNSVSRYANHPGRVSSLALLPLEHQFVAATCPDDPHSGTYKGQLFFYDIRNSRSQVTATSAVVSANTSYASIAKLRGFGV